MVCQQVVVEVEVVEIIQVDLLVEVVEVEVVIEGLYLYMQIY